MTTIPTRIKEGEMTEQKKTREERAKEERRGELWVTLILTGILAVLLGLIITGTALTASGVWRWGWTLTTFAALATLGAFAWFASTALAINDQADDAEAHLRKVAIFISTLACRMYLERGDRGDVLARKVRHELILKLLDLLEDGQITAGFFINRFDPDMLADVVKKRYTTDLAADPATLPEWQRKLFIFLELPEQTAPPKPNAA